MERDYVIDYDSIKHLSIAESLRTIANVPGIPLNELKVMDLSYYKGEHLYPGEGVYIFRVDNEIKLVGKAESMSFTERVPKHFDPRPYAWFHRLLELVGGGLNKQSSEKEFQAASREAFNTMNLVLIHFTSSRARIARTERMLRASTNCMNKFKRLKEHNLEKIVDEY
jgi:ribosomal protein L24E